MPWPTWGGVKVEPGTLTISGPPSMRLEPGPGVEAIAPAAIGRDWTLGFPAQLAYRVDRPELIPLRDVVRHFSPTDRRLFRLLATTDCLRLHRASVLEPRIPLAEAVAA